MGSNFALTKVQLISVLEARTGLSEATVRKFLDELFLLIAEELKFNGEFHLPRICKFKTRKIDAHDSMVGGILRFIPEHYVCTITAKDDLKDFVNGTAWSKPAKKAKRSGRVRKIDKLRENWTHEDKERAMEYELQQILNNKLDVGMELESGDIGDKNTLDYLEADFVTGRKARNFNAELKRIEKEKTNG